MTARTDLLARVEGASGPDRELDVDLAVTLLDWCRHETKTYSGYQDDTGFTCDACGADSWGNCSASGQRLHDAAPKFTASIDAALALMECVLPGAQWSRSQHGAVRLWVGPHSEHFLGQGFSNFPALAILAATLRALIAKEEEHVS